MTKMSQLPGSGRVEPSCGQFSGNYEAGKPQVVWIRLVADLETPVSAFLKLAEGRPYSFLFESVEGGAVRGRYSIIGIDPDLVWRANGNQAEVNSAPLEGGDYIACEGGSLAALRALLERSQIDLPEQLPPMAAGVVGDMGYDTVRLIEHLPSDNPDPIGTPDAIMVRPTIMVVFDTVTDEMTAVTPVRPVEGVSAEDAYNRAAERLRDALLRLESPLPHSARSDRASVAHPEPQSNTSPQDYMAKVARAKDYIAAGDIFQVVLSQRFAAPFALPPFSLYRALRRVNPSPFLYYLNLEGFSVVGSSPEILVRARGGEVTIRPIAGTRPRGATKPEDAALAQELLDDEKECAE
ncbi:MAG: anthranilate synthase component I family protein, partial [Methyloligellaceae bacterium]